jgi:hypothetical protein
MHRRISRLKTSRVRFVYSIDFTRPLKNNKLFIIKAFKTHINHYLRYVNIPYSRTYAYAKDMANYVYLDAKRLYSIID